MTEKEDPFENLRGDAKFQMFQSGGANALRTLKKAGSINPSKEMGTINLQNF